MLPLVQLTESESITCQELAEHRSYPDSRRRALGLLALASGHSFAGGGSGLAIEPLRSLYNRFESTFSLTR
jgi:hypothetical protein